MTSMLLLGCDNPTVIRPDFAYDPTQLTGGQLYRWSTGARVRVFVEPMAAGGIELAGAVQRAVVSWNAVPQEREFTLDVVTNRDLADVIVYDRSIPQPVVSGSCSFNPSGAAGYTYFCPLNGRAERLRPLASTGFTTAIVIRVDMTTTATQAALDALVAHEVGHAIHCETCSVERPILRSDVATRHAPVGRIHAGKGKTPLEPGRVVRHVSVSAHCTTEGKPNALIAVPHR